MVDKDFVKGFLRNNYSLGGKVDIHDDGTVDVSGTVTLVTRVKRVLPDGFNFGEVSAFGCVGRDLETLDGCPKRVLGNFNCSDNKLTSLKGAPEIIWGTLYCHDNPLVSLEGMPKEIRGGIWLNYSPNLPLLRTLIPQDGVDFENNESYDSYNHETNEVYNVAESIMDVINNQFMGKGKRGVPGAIIALLKLEKQLQKINPSINIRENIKW
jgi:hypothetical protein